MTLIPGVNLSTGTNLTTYTLALSTTAEFTQAVGGKTTTKAFLNQFVGELNKIYGSELAINFQLHSQNDKLIFENAATDGYTNGTVVSLIAENPIVINTALNGNPLIETGYDFGHVLGIGTDGGFAEIGAKARGATDLIAANASPGSIKAVAHELTHQMNANHTFNGIGSECGSDRSVLTAVEPGSGSTVMAYQNICGNDNLPVLPGDGAYFHAASFDEVIGYITGALSALGLKTATGNTLPTVNAGADRTIPASTPFTLTATASDPDASDKLTFTWEQIDANTPTGIPVPIVNSQDGLGPLFRSFAPVSDLSRTFPRIEDIVANTLANQNKNEHLPTQNRDLNFRLTARDNHLFDGKAASGVKSDDLKLTVFNTGAPFRVTSLNASAQIAGGSQQTVTWNVAGTDVNGINTTRVDILLSVDGGLTYPLKLASATNNDGSEAITIPNVNVAKARIKVQADPTQNVFFDINDADFQVTQNANATGGVVIAETGVSTKIAEGLFVQTGLPAIDTYTIALTKPAASDIDITITADEQILISLDGTNFAATQTIPFAIGDVTPKTVTVKATNDTLGEGVHTGTIRHAVTRSTDPNYSPLILTNAIVTPVIVQVSDDESPPLIGAELDFTGPDATVPVNWTLIQNPFGINVPNLIRENGESTTADLAITHSANDAGWSSRTTDPATIPSHSPNISLVDDSMFWVNTSVTATWSDLKPSTKYRVYVFVASEANVDAEEPIKQTITITGSGGDNPAPFVQDGTGKVTGTGQFKQLHLLVNGSVGSSANPLEQYGLIVTSKPDGKITVKVDPVAGGHAVLSALAVQEFLEPVPGFTVTETGGKTEVTEAGSTDTFTVVLNAQPASNVVLSISSANTAEATVDTAALTFTPQNWDTPRVITVTGIDDTRIDGDQMTDVTVSVNAAQSDARFASLPNQVVKATTKDNDIAGITVVEPGGGTEVSEAGTTDTFTVVLSAQPASDVVLTIVSSNIAEATVAPATLTYTSQNWNTAQTVTVTGVDDQAADGDQSSNITVSVNAAQSAASYANVANKTVVATNTNNDIPGFTIVETSRKTEVTEAATTDTFTVVLNAQPLANVVLNTASGNTAEATVDVPALTFTPQNWNTPQPILVTGVDDQKVDGDVLSDITVRVNAAQSAAAYGSVASQTVTVTTKDDDQAGFTVAETGGKTEVNETGTQDTITVVLSKQPLSDVVFNVTSADTGEATIDKATLTFTTANWNAVQTVTVTGVQDGQADGDQTIDVTISVNPANSNAHFAGLAPQSVLPLVVDSGITRQWQNSGNRFDVSGDGIVAPLDVLRIINELNDPSHRDADGLLPDERPTDASFYDVNGDGFATSNDVLQVINFLNAQSPEGESLDLSVPQSSRELGRNNFVAVISPTGSGQGERRLRTGSYFVPAPKVAPSIPDSGDLRRRSVKPVDVERWTFAAALAAHQDLWTDDSALDSILTDIAADMAGLMTNV